MLHQFESFGDLVEFGIAMLKKDRKKIKTWQRREFLEKIAMLSFAGTSGNRVYPAIPPRHIKENMDERIGIGIIGFGFRGEQLARSLKFAHTDWITQQKEASRKDGRHRALEDYEKLPDLKVELRGVSDVFEDRIKRGVEAGGSHTNGYRDYKELLSDKNIDAVIIATPDHWHARMSVEAAMAGKHVYLEKCMTRTIEEAKQMRNVFRNLPVVFQLGHQGRQHDANHKARHIIGQGILGKISLVETTTNRNNEFGAWLWPIPEDVTVTGIDWERFQEAAANKVPFDPARFFRWRCWYDYGTGMSGDLLTHEYDTVNFMLDLGIPDSAVASGGIYYYDDGRDVPDVFQANFEYRNKKLSLIYSGTLSNGTPRGTLVMGDEATLELGKSLTVWADSNSAKYKNRIESGIIDPNKPIANYNTENLELDALTSATSKYFADRGLMYTYQGGRRYDTTNLHLAEWLNCIRNGGVPGCGIEQGFQEAITAHMATLSYREGKKVYWDPVNETVEIS